MTVTLRELTDDSAAAILALAVRAEQETYVATNAKSLAQAAENPCAWYRGVYADDEPVGFIMLHDETLKDEPEEQGYVYLWRMMVDARYQGRGYGREALSLVLDYVRARPGAKRLLASHVEGPDSAAGFYESFGFRPTGNIVGGEREIEFIL